MVLVGLVRAGWLAKVFDGEIVEQKRAHPQAKETSHGIALLVLSHEGCLDGSYLFRVCQGMGGRRRRRIRRLNQHLLFTLDGDRKFERRFVEHRFTSGALPFSRLSYHPRGPG